MLRFSIIRARDILWSSPGTPPDIQTPTDLVYIRKEGSVFEEAVTRLLGSKEIGVSVMLEDIDQGLPRNGVVKLLSFSTADQVFIFDILAMGQNAFKWGLADIIKNPDCLKVTHDCRQLRKAFFRMNKILCCSKHKRYFISLF